MSNMAWVAKGCHGLMGCRATCERRASDQKRHGRKCWAFRHPVQRGRTGIMTLLNVMRCLFSGLQASFLLGSSSDERYEGPRQPGQVLGSTYTRMNCHPGQSWARAESTQLALPAARLVHITKCISYVIWKWRLHVIRRCFSHPSEKLTDPLVICLSLNSSVKAQMLKPRAGRASIASSYLPICHSYIAGADERANETPSWKD